ncbi:MAG: HPr family phosphocarrier protein [Clostridia bacterium]|nr:HPr family phosphocarrier protein [Clostridia bacterium]
MQEFTFIIKDKNGLHARPAGAIANASKSYVSSVTISCDQKVADGKRLLSVMSLGAKCGASLHFKIEGKDEELAKDTLYSVCEEKLGENGK